MDKKLRILYVDDETINLMLFNSLFEEKYIIITAESGKRGLELLEENEVDIVFSDMKMPEMNGLEFINHARDHFPNIVYYILSGYDKTNEITSAIENKVIDKYFQKPFNMVEIDDCIQHRFCDEI